MFDLIFIPFLKAYQRILYDYDCDYSHSLTAISGYLLKQLMLKKCVVVMLDLSKKTLTEWNLDGNFAGENSELKGAKRVTHH